MKQLSPRSSATEAQHLQMNLYSSGSRPLYSLTFDRSFSVAAALPPDPAASARPETSAPTARSPADIRRQPRRLRLQEQHSPPSLFLTIIRPHLSIRA